MLFTYTKFPSWYLIILSYLLSIFLFIILFVFLKAFFIFFLASLSGVVHIGMEVYRMDLEMSGLVERPWLQLMCCAICLLHGHKTSDDRKKSEMGVSADLVCRR